MDSSPQSHFRVDIKRVPPANKGMIDTHMRVRLATLLGTEVLAVPAGEVLDISLQMQEVDQGILVHFSCRTKAVGQCCRCLEDIVFPLDVDDSIIYFYRDERQRLIDQGDDEAEDYPIVDSDTITIEDEFIDAAIPLIPYQPLCSADCRGLCPECGEAFRHLPPGHTHDSIDPRFAALKGLFKDENER
ncbi:MAG: DUF177 domain-containing protein [Actinomycetaceae bacterium]|nr:DUF177 domain-containing protein [Actinomycetaceae bacterium]